jgi:ADP-ribose pyrophosphatase
MQICVKMNRPYEVTKSESYKIGRFTVIMDTLLIDGKEYPYSYIKEKDCSCVLPLHQDKIVLIRQYRHAIDQWRYEMPTGGIDLGESPEEAAKRELAEETGYEATELVYLGDCYIKPGTNTGKVYLYSANCENASEPRKDSSELIQVELFSKNEFERMIDSGEFAHVLGLVCWQRFLKFFDGRKYQYNGGINSGA